MVPVYWKRGNMHNYYSFWCLAVQHQGGGPHMQFAPPLIVVDEIGLGSGHKLNTLTVYDYILMKYISRGC